MDLNKIYEGKVIDLDYKADGIVLLNNTYVYIPGALKDELITFKLTRFNKRFGFGKLVEVLKPSKHRVSNLNELGSLNLSHLSFNEQLKYQKDVTEETFNKALNTKVNVSDIITDGNEYHYRNKVTYHVLNEKTITLGLYKAGSRNLVKVSNFKLANEKSNELLEEINNSGISVNPNTLKHVMIKNNNLNELLVTFIVTEEKFKGSNALIELVKANKNVVGITLNLNTDRNKILGDKSILLYGKDQLKHNDLLVTDKSFLQVNDGVSDLTLKLISKYIKGNKVLDLYSGIGSIIYNVLKDDQEGVMIESNEENVRLAKLIKEERGMNNLEIIHGLAETYLDKLNASTLIVDPPRAGLDKSLVESIKESNIERFIYLSCNLQSQIRDIRLLEDSYEIEVVYPIKMFPQTNSFETLVILNKTK